METNSKKNSISITTSGSGKNRDKLTRQHYYVALLTKDFVSDDKCLGELRDARAMKLPMYAIVKFGDYLPKWVVNCPWKKLVYFHDKDFESASKEIFEEIIKQEKSDVIK